MNIQKEIEWIESLPNEASIRLNLFLLRKEMENENNKNN